MGLEIVKIELVNKLQLDHPILNYHVDVGDGWYHIINSMLTCIEYEIRHIESARGWCINNNLEDMPEIPKIEFVQIKEKFGTLRVYYSGTKNDRISGIVSMAEHLSGHTCENCGNIGKSRNGSWITTLCNECFVEYELKRG